MSFYKNTGRIINVERVQHDDKLFKHIDFREGDICCFRDISQKKEYTFKCERVRRNSDDPDICDRCIFYFNNPLENYDCPVCAKDKNKDKIYHDVIYRGIKL